MKRLLSLVILVFLVSLLIGCNGVVPPPPQEAEKFVGTWVNVDPNTDSITKVKIEIIDKFLAIEVWGKCEPEDCYWGKEIIDTEDAKDGVLEIEWQFGFSIVEQEFLILDGVLKVTTFTDFLDPSRPDYETIDYCKK
jgi:hypothetical protein